jgi:hypothetical protein
MSGPTTNFVGNHMMQGAIDLVQSELVRQDPRLELRQARLDAARGIVRAPPQLLAVCVNPTLCVNPTQVCVNPSCVLTLPRCVLTIPCVLTLPYPGVC